MSNILIISNWQQLVKARSEDYTNLRITVTEYNSSDLKGTQISVIDYNTNTVYFKSFVNISESTLIPNTAKLSTQDMITAINNYGFNIRISEPEQVEENVLTILQGLYAAGYRYIYKDYPKPHNDKCDTNEKPYRIYASDIIQLRRTDLDVSNMPGFIDDQWDWCLPFTTYPISDILENGTVNNGS